jgi:hypothetical protein
LNITKTKLLFHNSIGQAPREFCDENKHKLLQSLENCDWPIKEHEIEAVEREIELAYKYLQQSEDIRKLIIRKEDIIPKEKKIIAEKVYLNICLNQQKFIFIFTKAMISSLKLQKTVDENSFRRFARSNESLEGKTILARHDLHGYYYEVKVFKQNDSRHVSVRFENGAEQLNVPTLFVLRMDGTESRSYLDVNYYLFAHLHSII